MADEIPGEAQFPLPYHRPTMICALWAFGMAVVGQFGMSILRGRGRFVRDASWQVLSRLLTAGCIVLALCFGATQPWEVFVAQFIGAAAFFCIVTREEGGRPLFAIPFSIYKVSLPFVWLDFATIVYFRADMVLFKFVGIPLADIGHYGVAYRLIEAFLLIANPVGLILFRKFRAGSDSTETTVQQMIVPALAAGTVGAVIALSLWQWGEGFVALAYGRDFAESGRLLAILGCSLVFALVNGVINQAALATGIERWCAISASSAAVVNILGNLLLLPRYGVEAAAWMTVFTEAVLGVGVAWGLYTQWEKVREI